MLFVKKMFFFFFGLWHFIELLRQCTRHCRPHPNCSLQQKIYIVHSLNDNNNNNNNYCGVRKCNYIYNYNIINNNVSAECAMKRIRAESSMFHAPQSTYECIKIYKNIEWPIRSFIRQMQLLSQKCIITVVHAHAHAHAHCQCTNCTMLDVIPFKEKHLIF